MNDTLVRLEVFEGPLELLLYLVRKNELDVFDIPIARLTDDYPRPAAGRKPFEP